MLTLNEITKEYPTPTEPLRILQGVSLELKPGDNLAVVGPSGCGKSTLLQIIGTLDSPTSGSVKIGDTDPFSLKPAKLADFRNQQIGFVFQDHHLLPQLSAIENVLMPTLAQGRPDKSTEDRAKQLLEKVGLADRQTHLPGELSGGERQRVAIARALVGQPALLLADEPTGNLDENNATAVADLLLELQQTSAPPMILIIVTHSQDLAERMQQKRTLVAGKLC